jgi:transcriptional regulator with XRE-family HTH domain
VRFQPIDRGLAELSRIVEGRVAPARPSRVGLTQAAAAEIFGLSQPKVSALLNGHFQGYSQERLIGLLNRLGCDVEIIVKAAPRRRTMGRVSVAFA